MRKGILATILGLAFGILWIWRTREDEYVELRKEYFYLED